MNLQSGSAANSLSLSRTDAIANQSTSCSVAVRTEELRIRGDLGELTQRCLQFFLRQRRMILFPLVKIRAIRVCPFFVLRIHPCGSVVKFFWLRLRHAATFATFA